MKKALLLFASGFIALSAVAQERVISVHNPLDAPFTKADVMKVNSEKMSSNVAYKTTSTPGRWYSYGDYLDQHEADLSGTTDVSFPYLWRNNNVMMTFSGTPPLDTNNLVSIGMVMDPSYGTAYDGFNNNSYYSGLLKLTPTDAFTVDSISFTGAYVVNPSRSSIDTFRVSFVYGTGAPSTNIHLTAATIGAAGTVLANYGATGSTLNNYRMDFDAIASAAMQTSGAPSVFTYDVIVNNGATPPSWTADTLSNGIYYKAIPVGGASGIAVPAGNLIAASVSHLSGDAVPMWATVFVGSPTVPPVNYTMFRPTMHVRGTNAAPSFPTYLAADKNNGVFVDKLTANQYYPQWYWSSGTAAATVQYPDIHFHITCPTCGVVVAAPITGVGNIASDISAKVYPNPANNVVNIPFSTTTSADVTVTLTNMLGQVVATQNINGVVAGRATFNTTSLPGGLYVYNVVADGKRFTGNVSIAH